MAEIPPFPETDADQPVPDPAVETSQPDLPVAGAPSTAIPESAPESPVVPMAEVLSESVLEAELVSAPLAESVTEPIVEPVVEPVPEPLEEPVPAAPPESALWAAAPEAAAEPIEPAVVLDGVASTITVPPRPSSADGEGGEWDLLVSKVQAWLDGARFQERWDALGGPLRAFGLLLAALVVLRLYGALLDTLGDLPLLPRLLQLVGLVSLSRFALTRLVRSSERERILTSWRQRWDDFRGRA